MSRCGQTGQNQQRAFYWALSFRKLFQPSPSSMLWHFGRKPLLSKHYHWSCTSRCSEPIAFFRFPKKGESKRPNQTSFSMVESSLLQSSAGVIPRVRWNRTALSCQVAIFPSRSDLQFSSSCVNTQLLPCLSPPSSSRGLAGVWKIAAPVPHLCLFLL